MGSIISINDLSKDFILRVLDLAAEIDADPDHYSDSLKGKIMASLFYEPSTRTMLSFHSAMSRLGGKVIGFSDPKKTSSAKGESIHDTIKMVEAYSDVVVIRHNRDGAARLASECTKKPVINAGDGSNQHPTQTLLDLYSIRKTQQRMKELNIALVGDLKYGRTAHSLAMALERFDCRLFLVSPESLSMPESIIQYLKDRGVVFSEHRRIEDVMPQLDILYMTRIQRERFPDQEEYERVRGAFVLRKEMLRKARDSMKVMHPLPRVNEIATDVDDSRHAYYFDQAENGIPTRMALLYLLIKGDSNG